VFISGKVKKTGHVTSMEDINSYRMLVKKPKERNHFGDLGGDPG